MRKLRYKFVIPALLTLLAASVFAVMRDRSKPVMVHVRLDSAVGVDVPLPRNFERVPGGYSNGFIHQGPLFRRKVPNRIALQLDHLLHKTNSINQVPPEFGIDITDQKISAVLPLSFDLNGNIMLTSDRVGQVVKSRLGAKGMAANISMFEVQVRQVPQVSYFTIYVKSRHSDYILTISGYVSDEQKEWMRATFDEMFDNISLMNICGYPDSKGTREDAKFMPEIQVYQPQ